MKTLIALVGIAAAVASPLYGQVGYPPAQSPYVDLEFTQELTVIGGWYHGHRDAANVGPQSGAITGLHTASPSVATRDHVEPLDEIRVVRGSICRVRR